MIVNLEVSPTNPLYLGLQTTRVTKKKVTKYFIKARPNDSGAEAIRRNLESLLNTLDLDDERPIQITGSAPPWVYTIVAIELVSRFPKKEIDYKEGNCVIKVFKPS